MNFTGTAKELFRLVAIPPLRLAINTVGWARMPDGHWFDLPKGFHPLDYFHLWEGSYEGPERKIIHENFEPDHTIIEIGANIGVVSCAVLEEKLGDHGTLICIEPNPIAIRYLKSNILESANDHRVEILPIAVGSPSVEGEQQIFYQKMNLGSGLGETAKLGQKDEVIIVPVHSLSSIVNRYATNGYSLICDAEGAEAIILEKDPGSLDTCRQIVIELHPPEQTGLTVTPDQMVARLQELGFQAQRRIKNTYYFDRHMI